MTTVPDGEMAVDELPNGLPLFNIFLHLPAIDARLQVFRIVHSYVTERVTLHAVLVHPREMDAIGALAGSLGFFQLHGEIWVLRGAERALTLGRTGRGVEYEIACAAGGGQVRLADKGGHVLATEDQDAFGDDDLAKVRLLCAGFRAEYDDHALSVPFVRAYPGRTSLISRGRCFPRVFAGDPIGPATCVSDPWTCLGDVVAIGLD